MGGGGEEEEEEIITRRNWKGKHNSLSRGAGADQTGGGEDFEVIPHCETWAIFTDFSGKWP